MGYGHPCDREIHFVDYRESHVRNHKLTVPRDSRGGIDGFVPFSGPKPPHCQ